MSVKLLNCTSLVILKTVTGNSWVNLEVSVKWNDSLGSVWLSANQRRHTTVVTAKQIPYFTIRFWKQVIQNTRNANIFTFMNSTLRAVENRRKAISDMPYTKLYIHSRGLSATLSFVTWTLLCCCPDVVCVSHIVSVVTQLNSTLFDILAA